MRSAMLLSGLTTWLSMMTASRNASIVGSNASSPGVSRFSVSATVAPAARADHSCAVSVSITPPSASSLSASAVLGQHPLDQPVLGQQLIDQPARLDGAHQAAVLLRQPGPAHRPASSACPPGRRAAATGRPDRPAPAPDPAADPRPSAWPVCWPVRRRRRCPACARPIPTLIGPDPRALLAMSRPASATASPTRTGAVARSVSVLPRFMALSVWAYAQRTRCFRVVPGNKLTGS